MTFNIEFDYRFDTNGFFDDAERRTTLEAAAQIWENLIDDEFDNVPAGIEITVRNPQTGEENQEVILDTEIDDLLIFVGTQSPPFGIGIDGDALARGGPRTTDGSDFEPFAGNISFDPTPSFNDGSSADWFFDQTPETDDDQPFGSIDFLETALHEIGHVLGIGTANIFSTIGEEGALFDGPNALSVNEGNPIPLENDLAHVLDGFTLRDGTQALMSPVDSSRVPTVVDLALLADIGYEVDLNLDNSPPVAVFDTATTTEGEAVEINVVENDTDSDGTLDLTSVTVATQPTNGTVAVDATTGVITYTPNAAFTGTDSFTYTVDDNEGETSNAATVEVTVDADVANVAPVATNDTATTAENTAIAIPVLDNDTDSDGTLDLTSVTVATQPTNGTVAVDATTGVITYTPNAEFTGSDTFTYTVDDNEGETSNAATVEVTVDADVANVAPVAINDTATTAENTAIAIPVLNNDTDSDGTLDLTSVAVATQPTNGTVSIDDTTGVITYTPNANFTGTDSFTYTVDDNEGETSNAATVEVTVDEDVANVAPVATNDTATTAENTAIAIPVLDNDTDSDGTIDPTTVTIATSASNGTVAVNPTTGVITYTPDAEFAGTDSFTYTVDDNEGETSNAATVEVTVDADVVNVAPVATNDTATTAENTAIAIPVLDNDTDSDGTIDPTTVTIATSASNGTVAVNPTTGVITYTPDAEFAGTDSFTYTVDDNEGETSNAATVEVTVDADVVNVAPVATNDTATTAENTAIAIAVLNNDTDSDGTLDLSSVTVVTQPSDGNLQVNSTTGVVTYTPDANFTGNDTFTYTVADNEGENSNPATVNITVNPVEEVPPSLTLEDDNIFSFGSNATEEVNLKFTLDISTGVDAANTNEIGVVEVDSDGNIIPGTEQVIFSALNNEAQDFLAEKGFFGNSFSRTLTGLSGDSRLVFYLVPNSTTDAVGNITRSNSNVIFGSTFGVANVSEQLEVSELGNGSFELSFEDIVGGDPQGEAFGDLVVNVELTDEESIGTNLQAEKELIDLSDFGSEQFTTEIIATANAGFDNEGGLYVVQDTSGTVLDPLTGNELSPNDPGYAAAALGNSVVEFDKIDPDPFLLAGGFIYAPYLKANGSEEEVYFAFSEANPGESRGVDHVRSIADRAFAFEDLIGGGDLSYDDFIFEVNLEPIA